MSNYFGELTARTAHISSDQHMTLYNPLIPLHSCTPVWICFIIRSEGPMERHYCPWDNILLQPMYWLSCWAGELLICVMSSALIGWSQRDASCCNTILLSMLQGRLFFQTLCLFQGDPCTSINSYLLPLFTCTFLFIKTDHLNLLSLALLNLPKMCALLMC